MRGVDGGGGGGGWSQMRLCGNNLRLKLIKREHVERTLKQIHRDNIRRVWLQYDCLE